MKLIDKHFEWMAAGILPNQEGLCFNLNVTKYSATFNLFHPTWRDTNELFLDDKPVSYWGREKVSDGNTYHEKYTHRRQTVVLFICAMHGEI